MSTVEQNFYIDNCLKSVQTPHFAVRLVQELTELLKKGGFRLTKRVSNSREVVESIPEKERATLDKNLDFEDLPIERALGIQWNASSGTFGFKITIKDKPATRRGILSIISSVYDPLGFVAPFILPAKIILQDLCKKKLGTTRSQKRISIAGRPGLNPYRCSNVSVQNVASQLILKKLLPANFTTSAMPPSWHMVRCPIYAWLMRKVTCTAPLTWGSPDSPR